MTQHDNENEILARAIRLLWPELPDLLDSVWQRLEQWLESYLDVLENQSRYPAAEVERTRTILRSLFRRYGVGDRLRQVEAELRSESTQPVTRGITKGVFEAVETPAPAVRYTDVACPKRVWLGTERFALTVRLTLQPVAQSAATDEVTIPDVEKPVRVSIAVDTTKLDVIGQTAKTIVVPSDADSDEAVFYLRPREAAEETTIYLHFWQEGNAIGSSEIPIEITTYEVSLDAQSRLSRIISFEEGLEPPALTLYVAYEELGAPRLRFSLYQGDELRWEGRPLPLRRVAHQYANWINDQLSSFATRAASGVHSADEATAVDDQVRRMGYALWADLIPAELQQLLLDNWTHWQDHSFLIFSNEPYIPWELVWPNELGAQPWCLHFSLGRWLLPEPTDRTSHWLRGTLSWRRWLRLIPTDNDLEHTEEERRHLTDLLARINAVDVSPAHPTAAAVTAALNNGYFTWLHAATHGTSALDAIGDNAYLVLEKRWAFKPDHLLDPLARQQIARQRPGVFFNTCQGGRQQWSMTGLGGWARRWISAGAGLFLSPLWTISDDRALPFARAFYTELEQNKTVGQAVRAARDQARSTGDPTWLAYSLFGHPNAQVAL